jgi:hypothetical protein
MVKTILNNNKDATSAKLSVNKQGLMRLLFQGENWTSVYYIVRKADI